MMGLREEVAAWLLSRDEGGDHIEWARGFIRMHARSGHCPEAPHPDPVTCSRCVVDGALKDADEVINLVSSEGRRGRRFGEPRTMYDWRGPRPDWYTGPLRSEGDPPPEV